MNVALAELVMAGPWTLEPQIHHVRRARAIIGNRQRPIQ